MVKDASSRETLALAFAALGIVFGDIGTSPVIAVRQVLVATNFNPDPMHLMGCVSMIFWALIMVVCIKYLIFVTRADNRGEGGVFALLALLNEQKDNATKAQKCALILSLLAASMLFADSLLTPALSIVAAIEGLTTVYEGIEQWVVIASISILLILFSIQKYGTGAIGRYFGFIMLVWFSTIALAGIPHIVQRPDVLMALNPIYGIRFMLDLDWMTSLSVVGAVLLAVTGAEAIYADMGHFGRRSISIAWFSLAFGALTLNYLGQVAWLMQSPPNENSIPFFDMVPDSWVIPLIVLTTFAGITASQAVISGMFSLSKQASQLNFLPRLKYSRTSERIKHQIYLPQLNLVLLLGAIFLVLTFRSSNGLAGAYGFAVSATMAITTISFCLVGRYVWKWSRLSVGLFLVFTVPMDMAFLAASIAKIPNGGYVTLSISVIALWFMISWIRGNEILSHSAPRQGIPLESWRLTLNENPNLLVLTRPAVYFQHLHQGVQGTHITPTALDRQVRLTSLLYSPSVIVHFRTQHSAKLGESERIEFQDLGDGIMVVTLNFGFAESPSIDPLIDMGINEGLWKSGKDITYFSARERVVHDPNSMLPTWMEHPYKYLHQFDEKVVNILTLPSEQYVELGVVLTI